MSFFEHTAVSRIGSLPGLEVFQMSDPFDLFVKESDGVLWFGTAVSIDDAHKKIAQHGQSNSAEYLIFEGKTGQKTYLQHSTVGSEIASF